MEIFACLFEGLYRGLGGSHYLRYPHSRELDLITHFSNEKEEKPGTGASKNTLGTEHSDWEKKDAHEQIPGWMFYVEPEFEEVTQC